MAGTSHPPMKTSPIPKDYAKELDRTGKKIRRDNLVRSKIDPSNHKEIKKRTVI